MVEEKQEVTQENKQKTNQTLFIVSIVALIAGLIALAILFMPVAILTGAVLYGNGDKRGLVGIVGGCIGLLIWWLMLGAY